MYVVKCWYVIMRGAGWFTEADRVTTGSVTMDVGSKQSLITDRRPRAEQDGLLERIELNE